MEATPLLLWHRTVQPNVVTYNSAISACEKVPDRHFRLGVLQIDLKSVYLISGMLKIDWKPNCRDS